MADVNDFNKQMIEQFRANHGKLGGPFEGGTMLLLHTTGAKTGKERVNPVAYQPVGDNFAVFASKAGAPTNPDWYHNLLAHPEVTVEIGDKTYQATAKPITGDERDQIYSRWEQQYPQFREYREKTKRTIPVIELELHES